MNPAPQHGQVDMALLVEERAQGQFYWVVLESASDDAGVATGVPVYRAVESAARARPSYDEALAVGQQVLQRLAH